MYRVVVLLATLLALAFASNPPIPTASGEALPPAAALSESEDTTKAKIAILGMFHFVSESNTYRQDFGREEVMSPRRQREIEMLVDRLSDFEPTKIAAERPYYTLKELNSKYRAYVRGDYDLTAEETDQIAFRLGQTLGHDSLYLAESGNPEFNMKPVRQYAQEHSQMHWIDSVRTSAKSLLARLDSVMNAGTVIDGLRYFNSEAVVEENYQLYKYLARVGERGERVGDDLMASWQAQNLRIFENIRDVAHPGDRVLVIYGAAHKRELRRYIKEARDLEYVDITDYL